MYEQMYDGRVFSMTYFEWLLKEQEGRGPNPLDEEDDDESQRKLMARYVCTKDAPWSDSKGPSLHPDAVVDGPDEYGWPHGSNYERYYCPNCRLHFKVTLPDS